LMAFASCPGRLRHQLRIRFPIRTWLRLALCLIGIPVCAEVPQAHVNPILTKLPIHYSSDIRFSLISTEDGLSQIRVSGIVQDTLGFIWFGTEYGLNRFDGYTFKVFVHEPNNLNSLSGVNILFLFKDRNGELWMGTEQSLDRFDPKTETFIHYPVPFVKHISQDRYGMLWLSTARGLYRLDQSSGHIRVFTHDANDPLSLRSNDVRSSAEDGTGRFWVAEPDGLDEFDRGSGHVKFHVPIRNPSRDFLFFEEKSGVFWIFYSSGNGLACFDRKTKALTYYSFNGNKASPTALSGVTAMLEDRQGDLWLATVGSGLLKLDRERHRFIGYRFTVGNPDGLAEDRINTLFEDREGCIWVALFGKGLQRFEPKPPIFHRISDLLKIGNPNQSVGCFFEDSHGNKWIGTHLGTYRIDASGKRSSIALLKPGVPLDVMNIIEDRSGMIWIGTFNNGLFRLDPKTQRFKRFRHDPNNPSSLSNDDVGHLLIDHDGTLWAATWDGLNRFEPEAERFTVFRADPHNRELIYLVIAEDPEHDLWLGTYGFGLQHFNPRSGQFTIYNDGNSGLSNNQINFIRFTPARKMWIATENGLNEFDPATRRSTVFGVREGLASNGISAVLEDRRGRLWMSTDKGISSFDPSTRTFRNFSTADGLPGPDMSGWGACLRSKSDQMFFAGFSGATFFFPDAVSETSYAPQTVITEFRLFRGAQAHTEQSAPNPVISYASKIIIPHNQNMFSLTFAALAYSNPRANRYRYMLQGLDNSWNEVGSDGRTVTYTSLSAGTYRFRAQGATVSSQWSEPGAELQIVILPPWWMTRWFIALWISAALLLTWLFYHYRMLQIAKQFEIRLEARVNERTRIARDLHDTLLQSFNALLLRFQAASDLLSARPDEAKRVLDSTIDQTAQALIEGRDAVQQLRSTTPVTNDLVCAIGSLGQALAADGSSRDNPVFHIGVEGTPRDLLPITRDEVYRIAGEALRNAFRHARARRLEVEIRYDTRQLRLRIRDDGRGIDPQLLRADGPSGHYGLGGMRERARLLGGQLTIWSEVNSGTEIDLSIPSSSAYTKPDGSRFWPMARRRQTKS
jgi:ligand-binding sensor domain-containing protein/signal transduction histidine kinase